MLHVYVFMVVVFSPNFFVVSFIRRRNFLFSRPFLSFLLSPPKMPLEAMLIAAFL